MSGCVATGSDKLNFAHGCCEDDHSFMCASGGVVLPMSFPGTFGRSRTRCSVCPPLPPIYAARFSDEEGVVGGYTLPPKVRHKWLGGGVLVECMPSACTCGL